MAKGRAGPREEPMARGSFRTLHREGAFDSNYREAQSGLDRDLFLLRERCQEVAELLSRAIRDLALAIIVSLSSRWSLHAQPAPHGGRVAVVAPTSRPQSGPRGGEELRDSPSSLQPVCL